MKSSSLIDSLKQLRYLPPPFNDVAPSILSIGAFVTVSLLLGQRMNEVWNDFCTNFDEITLWVKLPFAIYMAIGWGWALVIRMLEIFCPAFMRHFKTQPKEEPASWSEIAKMLPTVLFNQFVCCFGLLYIIYRLSRNNHPGEQLFEDRTNSIPSVSRFILLWVLQTVVTDIWFYASHRFMHSSQFVYQRIHAKHHMYKSPTCLETAYMHPIESIATRYAVLVVIPHVAQAPLLEFYLWVCAVTMYQYQDHSGYWLPFFPSGLMHDYHHQRFLCCYGVIGFMDDFMGTAGGYHEYVAKKKAES